MKELRALVRLALPIAAAQAGTQLMSLVDILVVGRLGAVPLAATALASTLYFVFAIFGIGVAMGIDPLLSQAIGAGDHGRARQVLLQGSWLAVIVSLVLVAPMLLTAAAIPLFGVAPEVVGDGARILLTRALGLTPMLVFTVGRAYLQATGHTRPLLVAMLIGNGWNFLSDLLLVFGGASLPGWCGPLRDVPALGAEGAAISTAIGTWVQLAVLAPALRAEPGQRAPRASRWPERATLLRALAVGLPVGLQYGAEVGIFTLVGVFAGKLGSVPLAAHQVVLTLASFTFCVALGVGAAASVRVGRAIGARDREGTREAGVVALGTGAGFMACSALVLAVLARPLAHAFTSDPAVVDLAVPLFRVAAVFQISDGVQAVGAGVLRGAAETRYAFVANLIGHWGIGLPIAWVLGFTLHGGIEGLWWGLCAGLTVVAALLVRRFLQRAREGIDPVEASSHATV